MKKKYITPACTTVRLRSPQLLNAVSENRYWGDANGDQGLIHFENSEVKADDGD